MSIILRINYFCVADLFNLLKLVGHCETIFHIYIVEAIRHRDIPLSSAVAESLENKLQFVI